MNWLLQIQTELKRIQPNENPGRTRSIARRIAGIALQEYYKTSNENFLTLIQQASNDITLPKNVRGAAFRLAARLLSDFTSLSVDPLGDAKIIVDFVKKQLHIDHE